MLNAVSNFVPYRHSLCLLFEVVFIRKTKKKPYKTSGTLIFFEVAEEEYDPTCSHVKQ